MIRVEHVVRQFGEVTAVDDLSFAVEPGQILGLLGPNGAGKTTTVKMLATLLAPTSGTITIAGHDVVREAHLVRQQIALTGQFAAVDEQLSGYENLELFCRLRNLSKRAAKARATELLDMFSLTEAGGRRASTYSGGMRRRLDIAISLVVPPSVLFLDEPTTGLDPRSRSELWAVVRRLKAGGMTIVLTTQYLEEADLLADQIVLIDHGRCIAEGTPHELKEMVGGVACEVAVLNPDRLDEALTALRQFGYTDATSDVERSTVIVPAPDGVTVLVSVLDVLQTAKIPVGDAGIRRPTLDEAYLGLTRSEAA